MKSKKVNSNQHIPYWNEADISSIIFAALADAVNLANLLFGEQLIIRHEHSLFKLRPDQLVVYDEASGLSVPIVEGKQPAPKKEESIASATVEGQIFDYALVGKVFGHDAPFVVLTSFEECIAYWLDETLSNDLAKQTEFPGMRSPRDIDAQTSTAAGDPGTPSPFKRCRSESLPVGEHVSNRDLQPLNAESPFANTGGAGARNEFTPRQARSLHRSNACEGHQLVLLIFNCIARGLQALDKKRTKKICSLDYGTRVCRTALKMSCTGYQWGLLDAIVGQSIDDIGMRTLRAKKKKKTGMLGAIKGCFSSHSQLYYVVGIIGTGDTSKVFQALDSNGAECTIKMYLKQTKDNNGNFDNSNEQNRKAKAACQLEVQNAKLLYGAGCGYFHQVLNSRHCVVMPFYHPIPKGERKASLGAVETLLTDFAKKNRKFVSQDRRWCHVGQRKMLGTNAQSIVLFDLADLVEISKADNEATVAADIKAHCEELKLRVENVEASAGVAFAGPTFPAGHNGESIVN